MPCPGLHCPGCSGGQSLAITGASVLGLVLADETVQWVADRVFWIGGTMAACLVLSVAASMWLETRADRRGRAWGAARGIYSRADVILPEVAVIRRPQTGLAEAQIRHAVSDSARPAIEGPQITVNIFGQFDAGQAAIIRTALAGQSGEAITEGNAEP